MIDTACHSLIVAFLAFAPAASVQVLPYLQGASGNLRPPLLCSGDVHWRTEPRPVLVVVVSVLRQHLHRHCRGASQSSPRTRCGVAEVVCTRVCGQVDNGYRYERYWWDWIVMNQLAFLASIIFYVCTAARRTLLWGCELTCDGVRVTAYVRRRCCCLLEGCSSFTVRCNRPGKCGPRHVGLTQMCVLGLVS